MHKPTAALVFLVLTAACGGGASAPTPAQGLGYVDPSSTDWRLVRDPASTPTRLVLNLVGPAGLKSRGAGFNLKAPGAVRFGRFTETDFPVRDGGTYELLNSTPEGAPDPLEPRLLAGGVKRGNVLTAGVFQKDRRLGAKDSGQPLLQIALELDPQAGLAAGQELPLEVLKARYMAEDIGPFSVSPTYELADKAHLVPMTIAVGTLHGQ